jgi:hypothetical protein
MAFLSERLAQDLAPGSRKRVLVFGRGRRNFIIRLYVVRSAPATLTVYNLHYLDTKRFTNRSRLRNQITRSAHIISAESVSESARHGIFRRSRITVDLLTPNMAAASLALVWLHIALSMRNCSTGSCAAILASA